MSPLEPDPILVLGAPRSGTTYLCAILASHPQVEMTNELRVFEWLHRALGDIPREVRGALAKPNFFVAALGRELPALLRRIYAERAPQARWWGDKNPHYAADPAVLATVLEHFPGARFVHIVRDPRAVIASLARKRHADDRPWIALDEAHVLVAQHLQNAFDLEERLGDETCIRVRYEELVADDVGVARQLFARLAIPFDPAVEAFCAKQREARSPLSGPTSDLDLAGSRDAARAAWRAIVPEAELRRSLLFLAPWLLRLGYEDRGSLDEENRGLPDEPVGPVMPG